MKYYQQVSDIGQQFLPALGVPEKYLELPCMEIILKMEKKGWNFYQLNAIKYLYRAGQKTPDPTSDISKAQYYIASEYRRYTDSIRWVPLWFRLLFMPQNYDGLVYRLEQARKFYSNIYNK